MAEKEGLRLPDYDQFTASIEILSIGLSPGFLHGMMCGYLCSGNDYQGEAYLQAFLNNKKDKPDRQAILALSEVFSISQQQINSFDFAFEMLLPEEHEPLAVRALAFSQWCEGFTEALRMCGVDIEHFYDEEAQDALTHLKEFAQLDCDSLDIDEEDERALTEVSEYARMAVIRLHSDLNINNRESPGRSGITH